MVTVPVREKHYADSVHKRCEGFAGNAAVYQVKIVDNDGVPFGA